MRTRTQRDGSPRWKRRACRAVRSIGIDQVFGDPQVAGARHEARSCRIRSQARCRRCARRCGCRAARCRTLRRRRCSASIRAHVLRDRLGIGDAALADLVARGVVGCASARLRSRPRHAAGEEIRHDRHHAARPPSGSPTRSRRSRRSSSPCACFRSPSRSSTSTSRSRATRRSPRRARSRRDCTWPRTARASPRASRTTRRRRTTSSSKAAASRAFAALTQGDRYCAVLVGSAAVHARLDRRDDRPAEARRHRVRIRAPASPKTYVRDRGAQGARCRERRARSPKRARRERLGRRSRAAIALLEQSQQTQIIRPRRPQLHVRAPRAARRGAHPPDARRRRRRADRHRAVRARSRVVRPPLPGAAQREQPDRQRSPASRRACSTASAAASSPCCGSRASTGSSGARRSVRDSSSARCSRRARSPSSGSAWFGADTTETVTTFWAKQGGARAADRRCRRARATRSCSWRPRA